MTGEVIRTADLKRGGPIQFSDNQPSFIRTGNCFFILFQFDKVSSVIHEDWNWTLEAKSFIPVRHLRGIIIYVAFARHASTDN